jgi:hypothetical protein
MPEDCGKLKAIDITWDPKTADGSCGHDMKGFPSRKGDRFDIDPDQPVDML